MTITNRYDLVITKDDKVVALQNITNWTEKEVEELWLIQEGMGRECQIKKLFKIEEV